MRSWLTTIALLIVVIALGSWVYYRPAQVEIEAPALSALKAGEVQRVRFERPGAKDATAPGGFTMERHDGAWRMTAPIAARVDTFQAERLLAILDARATTRLPATDPARFGFDQPLAILTIQDQTFTYGAINTATREQYVMTHNAVYLVPLSYSAALPRNVNGMLAKQLFAPGETPVRFDLPGFTVALQDGVWAISPASGEISPDDRNAWVDAWRQASAVTAERHDGRDAPEEIRVQMKDGRTLAIGIVRREPDLVLARRDEGVEYHFFADSGKRLLAPPGTREVTK